VVNDIAIYPNPVHVKLFIQTDLIELVTIYTPMGMPVIHRTIGTGGGYVDVSALPSGIYYMQLNKSGRVGRFVKE
jgi:hypothetical protein